MSNNKSLGLVSVLIVTWQEKEFLEGCFHSLLSQDYKKIEIIVVDNASSDGSQEILDKYTRLSSVKVIKSRKNLGFSGGNNLALRHATGEFVLMLNVDTTFGSDMVSKLVKFLQSKPQAGVVQPKLVFMSDTNRLDNIGAYLTFSGIPYYFGLYKSPKDPKYNKELLLYSTKGACMMIKREVIKKIGFLDEYMFAYFEESDFCHRVWLAGYQCWYTPSPTVTHFVGATVAKRDNSKVIFYSYRNRIRSYIKNFQVSTLVTLLPMHLLAILGFVLFGLARGKFKMVFAILNAVLVTVLDLPDTLRERKVVQKRRTVDDSKINCYLFKNPRPSYYYFVATDLSRYKD